MDFPDYECGGCEVCYAAFVAKIRAEREKKNLLSKKDKKK